MKEEIISNFKMILEKYDRYFKDSPYLWVLLVSIVLIFLISKKEDKKVRVMLVALPLLLVIILFNPFFYKYAAPFVDDGGTYWRFFWLLPIAPVVAYLGTRLVDLKDKKIYKVIATAVVIVVIVFSGKIMFTQNNYQEVNNVYKIPDDILNAIQIIENDKCDSKKAMIPIDMVPWVRQYCGTIDIMYNRNVYGQYSKWIVDYDNGFIKKYIKGWIDKKCNYFIVKKVVQCDCEFENFECELIGQNNTYLVYKYSGVDVSN